MKVRELIQDLLLVDPDLDVYIASDAEGNGVSQMDGNGFGWSEEAIDSDGWIDFDEYVNNAIVFWPV